MSTIKQKKVALMGFREVGKSSLAIQFVEGQFPDCYDPTIENTFQKKVTVKRNEYDLLLVDTAGQDEYTMFPSEYSVGMHGYVLVYSIDSLRSFEVCNIIHEKLLGLMGVQHNLPIILVGNKSDLHNDRSVSIEEGKKTSKGNESSISRNICKGKSKRNRYLYKCNYGNGKRRFRGQ